MMLLRLIPLVLAGAVTFLIAQDSFLDMGAIQGDSTAKGFEKQIEILGFTYEGSTLQKVTGFNSMIFSKRFDVASPKILEAAVKGTHLPEVTLTMTKVSDGVRVAFARVIMKDVVVTGVRIAQSAEAIPRENMTLQYDRADWCERPQNPNGSVGSEVCTSIVSK